MAKKINPIAAPYQTYQGISRMPMGKLPNTDLLPGVLETTINQKYIDALLGELTSKGPLESFDGWVGSKAGSISRKDDVYINDGNRLDIGIKSPMNVVGDLTDIAAELGSTEFVNFKDAKQLTSGRTYSYRPRIDPDKFINFHNYHWINTDVPAILIDAGFTENGGQATADVNTDILGNSYYTSNTQENGLKLELRNGMKIYFANRGGNGDWVNSGRFLTKPTDTVPKYFVVEGVGDSIRLLPYNLYCNPVNFIASLDFDEYGNDIFYASGKQYSTIAIGSSNYNAWSRNNRWYHEQTVFEIARYLQLDITTIISNDTRGHRPIIEFDPNLELWNYGYLGKAPVAVISTEISSFYYYNGTVNPVIDGYHLAEGDRVLFLKSDSSIVNKIYRAVNVSTGVSFVPTVDSEPAFGESVLVLHGNTNQGFSFHYDGKSWIGCQQLMDRAQAPIFRIFDQNGTPIEDYNTPGFSGNKIFGYAEGDYTDRELGFDPGVNGYGLAFDSNYKGSIQFNMGALKFTNYMSQTYKQAVGPYSTLVEIMTENYYRLYNVANDSWVYKSIWVPLSDIFTVKSTHSSTAIADGDLYLTGPNWVFDPPYAWNLSKWQHSEMMTNSPGTLLIEESVTDQPPRAWYDDIVIARFRDNVIYNYTGLRLQVANQRGSVIIDSTNIIVNIPKSLFDTETDILPDDYLIQWRIGSGGVWQTANIIARSKDDPRHPDVFVNGTLTNPSVWDIDPLRGLIVHNLSAGDMVDVTVNGSMINEPTADTAISNLTSNPYNETFVDGSYGQLFPHWLSQLKKSIIPLFVLDSHHANIQFPRFPADGSSDVFGDTDYEFSSQSPLAGNYILKHDHPANRYFWTLRSGQQGSIFSLLEDARKAYSGFKLRLLQKIEQLNLDQKVDDVSTVLDTALSEIFVGRDDTFRYARSHMIMWGAPKSATTYASGNFSGALTFDIPGNRTMLGEVQSDHVYVYIKSSLTGINQILTHTADYEVDIASNQVTILNASSNSFYTIKVYDNATVSFVPPTPTKLGITPLFCPGIVIDSTYMSGDVNFIQGHDGSLTPAWNDYRDQILLEFENRIAANVGNSRAMLSEELIAAAWPKKNRPTWYNKDELTNYLEEHWLTWANENNIVFTPNEGASYGYPFTYNYSFFAAADGNFYGSWRDLYKHIYGTDRPHTHPWEMLGMSRKPSWWDSCYSWTDPYRRNELMLSLLYGDRSPAGNRWDTSVKYNIRQAWLNRMPVDTAGNLKDPVSAGWYDSAVIGTQSDSVKDTWQYGQLGVQELAWRRSSDYNFSAAIWLLLTGGPKYLESVWEGPRLISAPVTSDINIDRDYGFISKWATANQHRENPGDVVPGFGMLVNEQAASLLGTNLVDIIDETRNIKSQLQWTANNFLESKSLSFLADILVEQDKGNRLPEENFSINLKVTSPDLVIVYSGVKVIQDVSGGYRIDGYDDVSTYFPYYPVDTSGMNHTKIQVGNISYIYYYNFTNDIAYLDYGTVLPTRQDVINFLIGYGKHLSSIGWVFDDLAPTDSEILDWGYSAKEFATWSQTRWQENTQIALSPGSQHLTLSHSTRFFGRLDTTFLSKSYLLNDKKQRIEFKDTEIVRGTDNTELRSRPGVGMYFVRCGLEEYTHAVTFDDVTTFNDVVNDYLFGVHMNRLRVQGLRVHGWNGRPSGNGYLITDGGLISNFDTISREIGDDYISIENRSANTWIKDLKKAQQGQIIPDNTLLNTGWNQDTIDQFETASLRRKGTPNIIEKFAKGLLGNSPNPQGLPFDAGISVNEDWMFRLGDDFGNVGEKITWEIKIPLTEKDILLNTFIIREIPEFAPNTYYDGNRDKQFDNIVDLLGPNDRRWVKHPTTFSLPLRSAAFQDGDLPQAGIANRFETDYSFMDIKGFASIDKNDDTMGAFFFPTRWDPTADYDFGDAVRYNGTLFKCMMSHLAVANFDIENWTTVGENILPSFWLARKDIDSNDVRDWTVFQTMDQELAIMEICGGTATNPDQPLVEMKSGVKHHLLPGDWVIIASTEQSDVLDGFYQVASIRDTESFFIQLRIDPATGQRPAFGIGEISMDGKLFPIREAHFYSVQEMKNSLISPRYEWLDGMQAYIDDRVNDAEVFVFGGNYQFASYAVTGGRRGMVFYDITSDNVLHQSMAERNEYMPWLFPIGMLLATFEQIKLGNLKLLDLCTVSRKALMVPAPKLPNFQDVATITVCDCLNGIVFRQFNDCALILAEKIYGNVHDAIVAVNAMFSEKCLAESAYIDLTSYVGYGTAMDLTHIATYIWNNYPKLKSIFATNSWFFRGMIYANNSDLNIRGDGIGMMAIENTVPNQYILADTGQPMEYHMIGIKTYGNRELMIVSMGYSTKNARDGDAMVLLDTVSTFGLGTGDFNVSPFVLDRKLTTIVDHSRISKVEIVDCINNKVLAVLNPFDPATGTLPDYINGLINWKHSYDPANYTDGDDTTYLGYTVRPRTAWFDEHIGEIWWDLSTVRYFDYYQGTTRERAYQWGRQFPGSSVDMYEWIKTTVSPAQWQVSADTGQMIDLKNISGTPYHILDTEGKPQYFWSERVEKDSTGILKTFYYFWVEGLTFSSESRPQTSLIAIKSTSGMSNVAYSSGTNGINTSPPVITVSEIANTIENPKITGARWFAGLQSNAMVIAGCSDLLQNPGAVVRIQVDGTNDEHSQWLLLKENDTTSIVPDWLHIRLRDSIIGTDQNTVIYNFTPYVSGIIYLQNDVVVSNGNFYRAYRDFKIGDARFLDSTHVRFANQPWQRIWEYTMVDIDKIAEMQGNSVPDYNRHPFNRYGNEIRPTQQSWLSNRIEAIRILIDVANRELASFPVTSVPTWKARLTEIITTSNPNLSYDMSDYWYYADYVESSYDISLGYSVKFNSLAELYQNTTLKEGEYAAVRTGSERLLNVWCRLAEGWMIVYQQKGTIQLNKTLFNIARRQDTWDSVPWDTMKWDGYPFMALSEIITALRKDIFIDNHQVSYSRLFFALVKETLRQNEECHWIRKSTFVDVVTTTTDQYQQDPYFRKQYLRNDDGTLIDYVNQVKPYHTKVLNQIEVDQLLENTDVTLSDSDRIMNIIMKIDDLGDQKWTEYFIDGHPFQHLQEGWDRNLWDLEFTSVGKLPSTGKVVSRLKQYLWDMDQPRYNELIDTILNGYSFGLQPEELQVIIEGNAFYQPIYDRWPTCMVPLSPGESIEIRVMNNNSGSTVDASTLAWRYHMDIFEGLRVYRYNTEATTTLDGAIDYNTASIPVYDASVLTQPDPINGKPGVIWIENERIVFYKIEDNVLTNLVRGTLGTSATAHTDLTKVYDGGQKNTIDTPENLHNWNNVLYPMWNNLSTRLTDSTTVEAKFLQSKPGFFDVI